MVDIIIVKIIYLDNNKQLKQLLLEGYVWRISFLNSKFQNICSIG